jgi:hypothetical protein
MSRCSNGWKYKQVSALEYILHVEPNAPVVLQWLPDEDRSLQMCLIYRAEQEIALPALGVILATGAIYDGIIFPAIPGLGRLS